jgi:D-3-phosphoglycerate dehydrogenase / 2-oxoglutarate reductase
MRVSDMSKKFNVLVLGNVREEGLNLLAEFAELTILPEPAQKPDILEAISSADAVLHKIARTDADVISAQKKLRIIARHGVGLDDLDLDAIKAAGIPVSVTPTANTNAVAEATVGLVLAASRKFAEGDTMIKRDGLWAREQLMGREIGGKIVGIVGFGRIGRRTAKLFDAFGAEIIVYDALPLSLADCLYRTADLDALLNTSDIVCLHCPLLPETRHLINAARLSQMKRGALLVNTSRGGLIDVDALVLAIQSGEIGGAVLDVFDTEPPNFDHPLFKQPQILTTPHVAAMTVEAQVAMAVLAAKEIRRVLIDGLPPTNNIFA